VSRKNNWDASATPSGIKCECMYVFKLVRSVFVSLLFSHIHECLRLSLSIALSTDRYPLFSNLCFWGSPWRQTKYQRKFIVPVLTSSIYAPIISFEHLRPKQKWSLIKFWNNHKTPLALAIFVGSLTTLSRLKIHNISRFSVVFFYASKFIK
jgi:hypothetical protein